MTISMKVVRWALLAAVYVTIVISAWPLPLLNYLLIITGVCAVWAIASIHEFYKGLAYFEEYTYKYRQVCQEKMQELMKGNHDGK